MINQELLDLLRCPVCVQKSTGELERIREVWLVCKECGRKYPIVEDIPVMLITEADKWMSVPVADLPVPPTRPE